MTRHYAQLKQYINAVARDYKGELFLAALQEDLAAIGSELGINLFQKGFEKLHEGIDRLAATGLERLGEAIRNAGKARSPGGPLDELGRAGRKR